MTPATWHVGGEDFYYQPPAELFIDCECGTCEDVAVCEIPGYLINDARDWLTTYCEYAPGDVEAMYPADVYREIAGCVPGGWDGWEREQRMASAVRWAA